MVLKSLLINIFEILMIFLISAIPLYFVVKFLRGTITVFSAIIISIIVGAVVYYIQLQNQFIAGIISFVVVSFIYRTLFQINLTRAFLTWSAQAVVVGVLVIFIF